MLYILIVDYISRFVKASVLFEEVSASVWFEIACSTVPTVVSSCCSVLNDSFAKLSSSSMPADEYLEGSHSAFSLDLSFLTDDSMVNDASPVVAAVASPSWTLQKYTKTI